MPGLSVAPAGRFGKHRDRCGGPRNQNVCSCLVAGKVWRQGRRFATAPIVNEAYNCGLHCNVIFSTVQLNSAGFSV
jgi:hypothetical protein